MRVGHWGYCSIISLRQAGWQAHAGAGALRLALRGCGRAFAAPDGWCASVAIGDILRMRGGDFDRYGYGDCRRCGGLGVGRGLELDSPGDFYGLVGARVTSAELVHQERSD